MGKGTARIHNFKEFSALQLRNCACIVKWIVWQDRISEMRDGSLVKDASIWHTIHGSIRYNW